MGAGYHGGFGNTKGSQTKKRIFTPVQYKGTVKVTVSGIISEEELKRAVEEKDYTVLSVK